jgi:hypothetical protein
MEQDQDADHPGLVEEEVVEVEAVVEEVEEDKEL